MNYFVIYKNGKAEKIPEIVAEAIYKAETPKINWKNHKGMQSIDLASISRLITEQEYYELNPSEKPSSGYKNYSSRKMLDTVRGFTPERRKRFMEVCLNSFKKHFEGRAMPTQSQNVFNHYLNKLNNLK